MKNLLVTRKCVKVEGTPTLIDKVTADAIEFYLISNGYVDMKHHVTDCKHYEWRQKIAQHLSVRIPWKGN